MKKRIVVLGGAGVLGWNLCSRLVNEGEDVICIDNREISDQINEMRYRGKFDYLQHDITKPFDIDCDEIYNLATPRRIDGLVDPIAELKMGSVGVLNTLNCAYSKGARVLYGSSDDVYNFNHIEVNYKSQNYYIAKAKRIGEAIHKSFYDSQKLDIRIARIFTTFGHGNIDDNHVVTTMIIEALNNRDLVIYGNGEQTRTFCWVDDMVDGLIKLMSAYPSDKLLTLDMGSNDEISIRALAELIISLCGSGSSIRHIEARRDEARYKVPQHNQAINELEWHTTTSLKEGLLRYINYIEKELSIMKMRSYSWVEIHG